MKKSTKVICIISGVLFAAAALYLIGAVTLPSLGLEFRFWVDSLGKLHCMIVVPLWIVGLGIWKLWQIFRGDYGGNWILRWLAVLCGGVAAVISMAWFFLAFLIIAFNTDHDYYVGGGMLSVEKGGFPGPTSYYIYERVGLFLRRKSSLTDQSAVAYLEEKYKREFYAAESDNITCYVDVERPDVTVDVQFTVGEMRDNYPQMLADHYLQEGYQALGLEWESQWIQTGTDIKRFCLMMDSEEDCRTFGEDVYHLIQYALQQDSLLEEYKVSLFYSSKEYEDQYMQISFGKYKSWEDLSTQDYPTDLSKITHLIYLQYSVMRANKANEGHEAQESNQENQIAQPSDSYANSEQPTPEPTPQMTTREMAEAEFPDQCQAAEAIWDSELKDLGYDYEPGFNAKGNLVIWLGSMPSDNLQSIETESNYYLTYDRESKNGNCYLFVLSEVPEGKGLNDAYLREFYACEKKTLKVVAGNKTSWGQPGCEEYQKITGE